MNSNNPIRKTLGQPTPIGHKVMDITDFLAQNPVNEDKPKDSVKPKTPAPFQNPPSPANEISNPENYIILEAKNHGKYNYDDTLVAMELSHKGKDWNEAHILLGQEGAYMLSIRQFADFLSLLKSGKAFDGTGKSIDKRKLDSILEDITAVRDPWRLEWLDADFKLQGKKVVMNYEHRVVNGKLVANRPNEILEGYLAQTKNPEIDLNDWIARATYQGLPPTDIKDGSLYYWQPGKDNNSVARFGAGSDWADLDCNGDPTNSGSYLGVRSARKKISGATK